MAGALCGRAQLTGGLMTKRPPLPEYPKGVRAAYWVQQVLMHLALPLITLLLLWRGRREPGHLRGWADRLGFGPVGPKGAVWIYAASLGETRAASPLIRRLRADGIPVILSHLSPAGMQEGWRLFPEDAGITHRYVPIDLFWAVRLFLRRAKPRLGIVLEIEIWPAMLVEAHRTGVPMVMANGNLLARSLARQSGLRRPLLKLYQTFTHIFTRTEDFRDRYLSLGVAPDRISVVGEMKYDQWIDPRHPVMGQALRASWDVRQVLMIASSVKDEEPALMAMVQSLLDHHPELGVLWVPRSAQRFDPVAEMLASAGVPCQRRSTLGEEMGGRVPTGTRVILGDSLGEMNAYYPVADLVFVGASLVDHGGHNIMEPMAFGKAVVMGPSTFGIAFAAEPAARAGAFESLADAAALQTRIAALLADGRTLDAMGKAALAFAHQQTGAADRTYAGLKPLIAPTQH